MDNEVRTINFKKYSIGKLFELRTLADENTGKKPCARSGHRCVANKKCVYVFGGYNPKVETLQRYYGEFDEQDTDMEYIPLFDELWEFNFSICRWKKLKTSGPMPMELASMAMLLVGSTIVVYGGTGFPFGHTSSNKIYTLSLNSLEWKCHECNGYTPVPTYGSAISINDGNIYVYGGTTGSTYTSDVDSYNMKTQMWKSLYDASMDWPAYINEPYDHVNSPRPRYRHEMISDQECLYILGGGTALEAFELDIIYTFNFQTNTWGKLESKEDQEHGYPGNRRCFGCCQLNNNVYVSGGRSERKMYDDIWRLSLTDFQWTKLGARLLFPLFFHASAVTPSGCMYIHGGVKTLTGDKRSLKLSRIWLVVPNLLELCWEKVLNFIPNIQKLAGLELLELGIPQHLIAKLT